MEQATEDKVTITIRIPRTLDRALELEAVARNIGKGDLVARSLRRVPQISARERLEVEK